jgi:hypothetical protein
MRRLEIAVEMRKKLSVARRFPAERGPERSLFKRDEYEISLVLEMFFQSPSQLVLCRKVYEAIANVVSGTGVASRL